MKDKRILFIGAHTDDVEYSCGGTIKKLSKYNDIYIVTFSSCEKSIPAGFSKDILKKEFLKSMELINSKKYRLFDYPVRTFSDYRQAILEDLILINKEYSPDIIFFHSGNDIHQDHNVMYNECIRAYFNKNKTLITYQTLRNTSNHNYNLIISLNKEDVDFKLKLIRCYKSQLFRGNYEDEIIKTLEYNGMLVNDKYVELFEIIKTKYI